MTRIEVEFTCVLLHASIRRHSRFRSNLGLANLAFNALIHIKKDFETVDVAGPLAIIALCYALLDRSGAHTAAKQHYALAETVLSAQCRSQRSGICAHRVVDLSPMVQAGDVGR